MEGKKAGEYKASVWRVGKGVEVQYGSSLSSVFMVDREVDSNAHGVLGQS